MLNLFQHPSSDDRGDKERGPRNVESSQGQTRLRMGVRIAITLHGANIPHLCRDILALFYILCTKYGNE
jgi:hypothetical protein